MAMTIDKAIAKIWHCIVSIRDCTGNKEFVEALILSVEIMRKYQKIKEIAKSWKSNTWTDGVSYDCMLQISEVIEDGNDNQNRK